MNNHKYRFDSRSKDEFMSDIKRSTAIERWLVELYVEEKQKQGNNISYINNGVDNTGEFVERATSAADYKFTINGESRLIEVKTSPIGNNTKSTFKVSSLKANIKDGVYLLVFYNIATRSNNFKQDTDLSKVEFIIVSPYIQRQLLDTYPAKAYGKIMGGKPCIKIPAADYPSWFNFYPLYPISGG